MVINDEKVSTGKGMMYASQQSLITGNGWKGNMFVKRECLQSSGIYTSKTIHLICVHT